MIKVNLGHNIGALKEINGISCYDSAHPKQFFEFGFPSVRLHDQDGDRPFVVDIAAIFPYWGADELDPESYDFRDTDRIIGDLVSHDTHIIYRLGNTIDHTPYPRLSVVPNDFAKWARVCEHIIMHYNEGWKDGFHYGLEYWEIWNEPDLICLNLYTMWQGTEQQYFDLYRVAATYLKARFPSVKIGGYGAARSKAPFFENFLKVASEEQWPLDFFTWHRYGSEVEELVYQADRVRRLLDQYGYVNTESILDEWNYTENDFFGMNSWELFPDNPTIAQSFFTKMRTQVGAAYDIAVMIELLDHPVDRAHLYDGQRGEFGSLFDQWGNLTKTAHAVLAFNKLIGRKNRVEATSSLDDVRIAASSNDTGADIMISCFECKGTETTVTIENCDNFASFDVYLINDFFAYEKVLSVPVEGSEVKIPISVRPYNVMHISGIKK